MRQSVHARPVALGKVVVAGLGALGLFWLLASSPSAASDPPPVKHVLVPAPPAPVTAFDTLQRGETLAALLLDNGLDGPAVHAFTRVVREVKSPRTLRPGVVAKFSGPPGLPPETVLLRVNPDSLVEMAHADSTWSASVRIVPVTVDTIRIAGLLDSSLWYANLSGDVDRMAENEWKEYVYDLADVFMWKIDFTRDIRPGDAFRVVVERERRPDGSIRSRKFLAIEFSNRGRILQAIPYARPDGNGHREFFTPDGSAMRGSFLRYPVNFRVTSSFNRRRYHPVLKRRRAHLGTDYGAPQGTPVSVTASGTVTRAGVWGGYGKMVEVRHAKGISTRYAHLSRINVRQGEVVSQGETIGRVGSTGLSTAAHLHYEFLQNGAQRNPAAVELPSAPALEDGYMADFSITRDQALALFDGVALPVVPVETRVEPVVAD